MTLWVNNCRAGSPEAWRLYTRKRTAGAAVQGQQRKFSVYFAIRLRAIR